MSNIENIPVISTGEPSTLKTYRKIAFLLDGFRVGAATKFIDTKISESSEDEIVISDERQMIYLLMTLAAEKGKDE